MTGLLEALQLLKHGLSWVYVFFFFVSSRCDNLNANSVTSGRNRDASPFLLSNNPHTPCGMWWMRRGGSSIGCKIKLQIASLGRWMVWQKGRVLEPQCQRHTPSSSWPAGPVCRCLTRYSTEYDICRRLRGCVGCLCVSQDTPGCPNWEECEQAWQGTRRRLPSAMSKTDGTG